MHRSPLQFLYEGPRHYSRLRPPKPSPIFTRFRTGLSGRTMEGGRFGHAAPCSELKHKAPITPPPGVRLRQA
jgi:hypothetical protein